MLIAAVSGGLDSVAMLWRLLTETEQPIHVHHVEIRNRIDRGRWRVEAAALDRLLPRMRSRARDFAFTTSKADPRTTYQTADIVVVTGHCARMAFGTYRREEVTGLARGANLHDMGNGGTNRRQAAAARAWQRHWGPGAPPIVFPIADLTRPQLWGMLPEELARLTWSCRRPIKVGEQRWQQCGGCETCRELTALGVPLERAMR